MNVRCSGPPQKTQGCQTAVMTEGDLGGLDCCSHLTKNSLTQII
uniref:Uncharacterized protein n=1 Tax=Anguilla anguilla TaxID=7936 RepID=A0A0E9Q9D4_ANGAN